MINTASCVLSHTAHIAGYAPAVSAQDFAYRTSKLSDYSDMIRPVEQ